MIIYMTSSLIIGVSPVQMLPRAGSNATRFESKAGPARPLRLSVCPGIKIGLQWFITLYQASRKMHSHPPPITPSSSTSSPRPSWPGPCLSDFGASIYRSSFDREFIDPHSIRNDPHHFRKGCSPMVREEFIRHGERHMQVRSPSDSSTSPPPSPRQPPPAEVVGCVTQWRRGDHERDEASDADELCLIPYAE